MTRSNVETYWEYLDDEGDATLFADGNLTNYNSESVTVRLTYPSALNLASKLLQWATNLPEAEKGNIHKIDGEWVDIDNHPQH